MAGGPQSAGLIRDGLRDWIIVPANPQTAGNWGFVVLICLAITLVQVKGRWRTILLVPTIYLAAFVWETRLVVEPSITRQLMIGAILIVEDSRLRGAYPARTLGQSSMARRVARRHSIAHVWWSSLR